MRKILSCVLLAVLVACGAETVTSPPPTPDPVVAATPAPAPVTTTPPAAAPPGSSWWDGNFGNGGSYRFRNTGTNVETWTVYSTSFDNQALVLSAVTGSVKPGDLFEGTLNVTCRQVDIQQGIATVGQNATAAPFTHAFINGYGQPVRADKAREGCDPKPEPTPQPTPKPTPSPKPTPTPPSCETDKSLCPPPPPPSPTLLGYCHVSNKGKDGDVNLVVEFKTDGEGHDKHATDSKYCPKDTLVYGPIVTGSTRNSFECKLEGKDTSKYCACAPFLEAARACPR